EVCAGEGIATEAIPDLLSCLAAESLVDAEQADGTTQYRLLETTRAYAWERLATGGEARHWQNRHADCFLHLAEKGEAGLQGPEQAGWLRRLEDGHDNLRAALQWYLDEARRSVLPTPLEAGLRLAGALSYFWESRGFLREGRRWLTDLLALPSIGPPT